MNTTTIVSAIVALVIGIGGGYVIGNSGVGTKTDSNELRDAISMMNSQSEDIMHMGGMMKMMGMSMQEMGMKYKDDVLVSQGKDLQAVGEKHMSEDASMSAESGMMHMMNQ